MEVCEKSNSRQLRLCPAKAGDGNQKLLAGVRVEPHIQPMLWRPTPESAASIKVFTTLMLRVWRERRKDVRQLQQDVVRLQKKFMQSENQLHVNATLMRVEQKLNSELQLQLRESNLSIAKERLSCEKLQQDLESRKKEYEELKTLESETKSNLFDSLMEQHNLQKELAKEKQIVVNLQVDKQQLLDEILKIRNMDHEYRQLEDKYVTEAREKDEILCTLRQVIKSLEDRLQECSNKNNELEQLRHNEIHLNAKIAELRQQIDALHSSSNYSFFANSDLQHQMQLQLQHAKIIWGKFCQYTRSFSYVIWIYLSPGQPSIAR